MADRGLVLVTNYLFRDAEMLGFWNQLNSDLQAWQLSLLMLSTTEIEGATFPVLPIPYHVAAYADWFATAHSARDWQSGAKGAEPGRAGIFGNWADEIVASAHAADRGTDIRKLREGMDLAAGFYLDLIEALQPSALLAWNAMHSQTQLALGIARLVGVPSWAAERGWVRNTMMFDLCENSALSEWSRSVALRTMLANASPDPAIFLRLKNYHLARRCGRYGTQEALAPDAAREQLGIDREAPVWVAFTHGGPGIDSGSTRAAHHATSPELLDAQLAQVARLAAECGAVLLVQEHPINRTLGLERVRALEAGARIVEHNIHTLLDLAELSLHTVSTVQFDALYYGRPIVLLSRSPLSASRLGGRSGAYEVGVDGDLDQCLQAARAGQDWAARQADLERFVSALAQYQLVDAGEGLVPTTTADVAAMLGALMRPVPDDLDARVERFLGRWQRVG